MRIQTIRDLIYQAKYEETLAQIEGLDAKAGSLGLLLKSRIYILQEEYEQAVSVANVVQQKNKVVRDRYHELGAVVMKSYAFYRLGKVTEAAELLEKGQDLLGTIQDGKEWECLLYDVKARVCWTLGDLKQALVFSRKSLAAAKEVEDEFQIAESLSPLGLMHRSRGELDQSISYLARAFALAKEAGFRYLESYSWHVIGVTYFYQGDYGSALRSFEECMSIDEEDGKYDQISCSLFHIKKLKTNVR
ncbi:MAG: tetratricopeptide repeat protein [Candidatus Thorarchaeota archaeon]